jgi:hypothetical protein
MYLLPMLARRRRIQPVTARFLRMLRTWRSDRPLLSESTLAVVQM